MSATITLAKQISTGRIIHIDEVDKKQGHSFSCIDCNEEMIVVKTVEKRKAWHYRHLKDSLCMGARSTALHDYAVQVLMESTFIKLSKKLSINYTGPRKELVFFSKRSDVAVRHLNEDVHFEIFVSHDLGQEKIDIYKNNKIKCIRIDLSEPKFLKAAPEEIKDAVLNQINNKSIIYWDDLLTDQNQSNEWNFILKLALFVIAIVGLRYLHKVLSKPKMRFSYIEPYHFRSRYAKRKLYSNRSFY